MIWDCPEQLSHWQIQQENTLPVCVSEVAWSTLAQWQEIEQNMSVLVGGWHAQERPDLGKRSLFYWLNEAEQ